MKRRKGKRSNVPVAVAVADALWLLLEEGFEDNEDDEVLQCELNTKASGSPFGKAAFTTDFCFD